MKTNVLIAIETMVNGAIDLINQLINAANAVLDTGIEVIQKVTFGAEAAVASEASKRARAAALVDQQNETEKAIKERENNLNKMKEDTINALKERLREIAEARADAAAGTGTDGGGHAINPGDYIGNAGGAGDIGSNVGDIADNTGAIADAMEITTEELKYLRDIAEREAINRYTTAEVNIDMSGMKNTLNNNSDVDGFINQITFAINETIKSNAQGVHA
jgi:uncharacterized protein YdcH (DUF465 family)